MIYYQETKEIKDEQLRSLYESVGWRTYTERVEDLQTLLPNSRVVYSAWDEEQWVGLIRTIGDGKSIEYVQDLLVLPAYQDRGIGKRLFQYVLDKSQSIGQLVLITDGSEENRYVLDWYESQGLTSFEKAGVQGFWHKKK